jgi:hypothetical protein
VALHPHPLVFRQQKIEAADFPRNVQLASSIWIRDHISPRTLNKTAYRKALFSAIQMWADNLIALYYSKLSSRTVRLPLVLEPIRWLPSNTIVSARR